jgi:hypothetical protein
MEPIMIGSLKNMFLGLIEQDFQEANDDWLHI